MKKQMNQEPELEEILDDRKKNAENHDKSGDMIHSEKLRYENADAIYE